MEEGLDEFRRLLEQDDSQYEVVSSTKRRMDRLLAAAEDVIVVSTPPQPRLKPALSVQTRFRFAGLSCVLGSAACAFVWFSRRRKPKISCTDAQTTLGVISKSAALADTSSSTDTQSEQEDKFLRAAQLAQEVQLYQQVPGVSTSLAVQIVLEDRRIKEDTRQKHLDRRLSQKQHEESLRAQKYDPNWEQKLLQRRNECWTSVMGLAWQILIAHATLPVLRSIKQALADQSQTYSLAKLTCASFCGCHTGESIYSYPHETFSSWGWAYWGYTISAEGEMWIESGRCYANCAFSLGMCVLPAMLIHRTLSVLAAPMWTHNILNLSITMLWYRTNSWENLVLPVIQHPINFLVLVTAVLALLIIIQQTFLRNKRCVAKTSPTTFQDAWMRADEEMEALAWQIGAIRWVLVVGYPSSLWIRPSVQYEDN